MSRFSVIDFFFLFRIPEIVLVSLNLHEFTVKHESVILGQDATSSRRSVLAYRWLQVQLGQMRRSAQELLPSAVVGEMFERRAFLSMSHDRVLSEIQRVGAHQRGTWYDHKLTTASNDLDFDDEAALNGR